MPQLGPVTRPLPDVRRSAAGVVRGSRSTRHPSRSIISRSVRSPLSESSIPTHRPGPADSSGFAWTQSQVDDRGGTSSVTLNSAMSPLAVQALVYYGDSLATQPPPNSPTSFQSGANSGASFATRDGSLPAHVSPKYVAARVAPT